MGVNTPNLVWLVCFHCSRNSDSGKFVFAFQGSLGSPGLPGLPGPPGLPGMKGDRVRKLALQKVPYLEGICTMYVVKSTFFMTFLLENSKLSRIY